MKLPEELLDHEGYPTDEFIQFIKDYTPKEMHILDFVSILADGWYYGDSAFIMHRQYAKKIKLEMHTCGWSGNEDTISAILCNIYLTHFSMKYIKWLTGGHYYFEIPID